MSVKEKTICDNCGKESEQPLGKNGQSYTTPVGWYAVERLYLDYHRKLIDNDYRKKRIGEDPHFCGKSCLLAWFIRQIEEITKKEVKKKKGVKQKIKAKIRK